MLEAVILSLGFPVVNSVTDGVTVSWRGDVDLGMAVSVDNGLVVPVIRAAQTLTLKELNAQAKALAEKARAGKLTPDEMVELLLRLQHGHDERGPVHRHHQPRGGRHPGRLQRPPGSRRGQRRDRIRTVMAMTLSTDHRIVDGSTGALFVNAIRSKLGTSRAVEVARVARRQGFSVQGSGVRSRLNPEPEPAQPLNREPPQPVTP